MHSLAARMVSMGEAETIYTSMPLAWRVAYRSFSSSVKVRPVIKSIETMPVLPGSSTGEVQVSSA